MATSLIKALAKSLDADVLPDNKTHTNRMEIKSETSDRLYTVAQAKASGQWQCSCPGWIHHRTCKHLKAMMPLLNAASAQQKLLGGKQ